MKKLLAVLVALGLVGMVAYRINAHNKVEQSVKSRSAAVVLPSVTLEPVGNHAIVPRVVITGTIRPEAEVDVVAKTSGRILRLGAQLGDSVRKGQLLAELESAVPALQLKQAQGTLEAARANLASAQKGAESAEALNKSANIADVSLIQARAGLQAARAQVTQAEAAVGLAREALSNTRIVSPIDGVITRRNAMVGMQAGPGGGPSGVLFQVQSVGHLLLKATVDEKEVSFVKPGQKVSFTVDSLPGQSFEGQVSRIAPSLDPVSRRAELEISVANNDGRLYANMFARGEIQQQESADVLAVPVAALIKGADKSSVLVVEGDVAHVRLVETGLADGAFVAIHSGLKEGEQVVVSGHSRVTDGSQVQVARAAVAQ